jgi:hypothetical protein
MNRALLGLGVAIAVLAAVYLMRDGVAYRKPEADPGATWSARDKRHAPEVVLAISPKATPPRLPHEAPAEKPRLSATMQEFLSKQPYRALFERLRSSASRSPEDDYVLAELLDRCGKVAGRKPRPQPSTEEARARFVSSVSDADPQRDRRIAAWEELNNPRCAGIEVDTTESEIRALLDKAAAGGDPKARARIVEQDVWAPFRTPDGGMRMDRRNPSMTDAQLDSMREAVRSGDPEALLAAGRLFSSTMGDLVIRAGPEGRAIDPRVFHDAWTLAACEQGLACDRQHQMLLHGCAMQGNCEASDLRQYMFYYQHSPQQSQRLYEYQTHITRAIRSGDWSWFTFHRGAPAPGSTYHFFR